MKPYSGLDIATRASTLDSGIESPPSIYAFDFGWQYPAATEQVAFERMKSFGSLPKGILYVAFPWATLIDKLQTKAPDRGEWEERLEHFMSDAPSSAMKITTCQHIRMEQYWKIFKKFGFDHVFWSHSSSERAPWNVNAKIHSFPLLPIQMTERAHVEQNRNHLFSFVGARAAKFYLTPVRNWILDLLSADPRGMIIGRDSWHYNKIVYDHQVRSAHGDDGSENAIDKLIDQTASEQFRRTLSSSTFSLCPSGSGPNSIRLWESIGSGAIPVILADSYVPPGNSKLWEAAAVFCRETPEAVKELPDRLQEIALDATRLEAMRHAMRQLWLIYGPHSFVYDIMHLAASLASSVTHRPRRVAFVQQVVAEAETTTRQAHARTVLVASAGRLLLENDSSLHFQIMSGDNWLAEAVRTLPYRDEVASHYRAVTEHLEAKNGALKPPVPFLGSRARPKVCLLGKHSDRTPLSYEPFRRLVTGRVEFVTEPEAADVIMTGYSRDFTEEKDFLKRIVKRQPKTAFVVLSEEPLWDTTWIGGSILQKKSIRLNDDEVQYTYLNHFNTSIFDFETIPYFILTNDDFLVRYRILLSRHLNTRSNEVIARWRRARIASAFLAEYRDNDRYDKADAAGDIYGLSVYRTEVAKAAKGDVVMRAGKGWETAPRRQELPDWHLDKLARLDGATRVVSSYENTHQQNYISEKIFDAYVVGGIPAYFASPKHRIHEFVEPDSILNTFGKQPDRAAALISEFEPSTTNAEAWLATVHSLHQRFSDPNQIESERRRLVDEILAELDKLI